jgi:hypothetical protein
MSIFDRELGKISKGDYMVNVYILGGKKNQT